MLRATCETLSSARDVQQHWLVHLATQIAIELATKLASGGYGYLAASFLAEQVGLLAKHVAFWTT